MTESATSSSSRRDIPVWVSIPIIVLCLVGGGWFVWWYFAGEPLVRTVSVPPPSADAQAQRAGQRQGRPQRPPARPAGPAPLTASSPDGIVDLGNNHWNVKSGHVIMVVRGEAGRERMRINHQPSADIATSEQQFLMVARSRIVVDESVRKKLNVTDEQFRQLRGVPLSNSMSAPEPDMNRLKTAWNEYRSASDKAGKQNELLAELKEVSDRNIQRTRQLINENSEKIKSILTAEQLDEARKM